MTNATYWIGAHKKNGTFMWISTGDKVDNAMVEIIMLNLENKTEKHFDCLSVMTFGDKVELVTNDCDQEESFVCEVSRGIPVAAWRNRKEINLLNNGALIIRQNHASSDKKGNLLLNQQFNFHVNN